MPDPKDPDSQYLYQRKAAAKALKRQRLGEVRFALASMPMSDARIQDRFAAEWNVDRRTVRTYLKAVRTEFAIELEDQADTNRNDAILQNRALYSLAISKNKLDVAGRCLDRFIVLTGCAAPTKLELTGKDGGPIETQASAPIDLTEASDEVLELAAKFFHVDGEDAGKKVH